MVSNLSKTSGVLAAALFVAASAAAQTLPGGQGLVFELPGQEEGFQQELILVYDVTGGTLSGPVHTHMAVYNSGLVSYGSSSSFFLGTPDVAFSQTLPQAVVQQLALDLGQAGALTLGDSIGFITDAPITTITFMRPGTDTRQNTFSVLGGSQQHFDVQQVINEFVQNHIVFPESETLGGSGAGGGQTIIPINTKFLREPTLIYNVAGSTLLGPVNQLVTVYNDGLVSYASSSQIPAFDDVARVVQVPTDSVKQLTRDLAMAGAGQLGDVFSPILDVPFSTVTFMRPGSNTKAHTFSYLGGTPAHVEVNQLINLFLQKEVIPQVSDDQLTGEKNS